MNIQSTFVYAISALKRRFIRETATNTPVIPEELIEQVANAFYPTIPNDVKWGLNGRFERGVNLAKDGAVSVHTDPYYPDKMRLFQVRSSNPARGPFSYLVDLDDGYCECPDHMKGHFCKHLIASSIIELAMQPDQSEAPVEESPIPSLMPEQIVWGVIRMNGEYLGVEIVNLAGEQATVRALPKIIDGKKLQPQFPFDGKRNTTTLPKKDLFHVKVFQQA